MEHEPPVGGQHYSGRNRIPNIQEFVAQLDKEKAERDAAIDAELKNNKAKGETQDHVPEKKHRLHKNKKTKTVRDPVTGKDVEIEDAKTDFKEAVETPKISIPNENLGKEATVATSSDQSGEEYRRAQDITAPPDPVEPGSTSDVPIHSEKTNVLFYKTPSVSYEPMFDALEARANVMCAAIFFGIIFIGKFFGGSLWGLMPLSVCIASGVYLWCRELIQQGRNVEWSSEKERGETATVNLVPESVEVSWGRPLLSFGIHLTVLTILTNCSG
ncbi:hypothetical protein VDGD_20499 [Verticillium dahliae]|nr:hypothetical protein VDGD_20499 [Verticillium dahliae]